jgi:hypothetical protein
MRIAVILAFLACRLCLAQATNECMPSTLNIPSAQYPCVYPDHRATFRVVAPDAQKVQVRIGQTFLTTLANLDKFAYIGGFSGSTGGFGGKFDPKTSNNGVFADAVAFNKKVKVLFLGIGSTEGPNTKNFSDQLTKAGIKNVYFESPGTAHEWLTWRRCLNDFAPRLFR